jgi:FKBP-type peptidyl-prolyl cis-trans isomerase
MKDENVYLVPMHNGNGAGIKSGDMLSLAYKGYFISGRMFDSIPERNPLQFRYGDTAQVVKGLEIALKRMQEGEEAKIIIPSQLAFGENGSSTGIVPPYTTVIYEVRLLKVN